MRIRPLILAPLLIAAIPAHAADLGTLNCVYDKIDEATRTAIAEDVKHNLALVGQRGSYSDPVMKAMKDAGAACTTENKWSIEAERLAGLYTLAKLSLPTVQQAVTDRGLDPADLEENFLNLPEDVRNKPLATENYRVLADASIPEGPLRTRENGALLHTFFEFESILQYASAQFATA